MNWTVHSHTSISYITWLDTLKQEYITHM